MTEEIRNKTPQTAWHSLEPEVVLSRLASSTNGLKTDDAQYRLKEYGPNLLRPPKSRSAFERFAAQFRNVLIYVLLSAGALTAFLGHWVDSGVIIGVVLINAVIGFIQEGKAEKALEAIRTMLSHQALVLREGKRLTIPADQLVPGDLVLVQSGDKVPADLRLFKVKDLRIDEAALTGESVPVDKTTALLHESASVGDRKCMAYSGTLVTYGQGTGIVIGTGDNTEVGRINLMLSSVQPLTTRLLKQMGEFGQLLTAVTLALSLAFEPPEAGVMQRPPRNPKEPLFSYFLFWRIVFVSLVLVVGTFGLFLWDRLHGVSIESARAVAVNTLVMFEVFYLLNSRYLRTSVLSSEGILGKSFCIDCNWRSYYYTDAFHLYIPHAETFRC